MRMSRLQRAQRGVTMLVVLVLLSVMLLGGLALARLSEVGTLASGNTAYHEGAIQASEVGLNTAYMAVRGLTNESATVGNWYSPTPLAKDANGVPNSVDWSATPAITVGQMTVTYVVERACSVANITDELRECLVKQQFEKEEVSRSAGTEKIPPQTARQFRVTVRVTGPKGTQTFVQSLVTRGST
jgi:type IV pilus assembly protein PilX